VHILYIVRSLRYIKKKKKKKHRGIRGYSFILLARKPVAPVIKMVLSWRKWSTLPNSIVVVLVLNNNKNRKKKKEE